MKFIVNEWTQVAENAMILKHSLQPQAQSESKSQPLQMKSVPGMDGG